MRRAILKAGQAAEELEEGVIVAAGHFVGAYVARALDSHPDDRRSPPLDDGAIVRGLQRRQLRGRARRRGIGGVGSCWRSDRALVIEQVEDSCAARLVG